MVLFHLHLFCLEDPCSILKLEIRFNLLKFVHVVLYPQGHVLPTQTKFKRVDKATTHIFHISQGKCLPPQCIHALVYFYKQGIQIMAKYKSKVYTSKAVTP